MKKAMQISLAGTLFSIEEDAYAKLDSYLQSVKRHFASADGSDEIVRDIEARLAEQLLEAKKQVVSAAEVDAVIASMGRVEDFGDQGEAGADRSDRARAKKLYRSADDAIIGGVCSGLAAYLGVDPLWVRLGFVLLALATGFGILAYVLMWILVPEAKTASQKLEMAGEPINLETLSENVKEKVEEVKKKHGGKTASAAKGALKGIRNALNSVASAVIPALRVALAVVMALASLGGLVAASFFAAVALTNSSSTYLFDFPMTDVVSSAAFYTLVVGGYLAAALPLVALFFLSASLLRKKSALSVELGLVLLVAWCAALVATGAAAFNAVPRIETYIESRQAEASETRTIALPEGEISSVRAKDGVRLVVVQGVEPSLVATGRADDLDRLQASLVAEVEGGTLSLSREFGARTCLFCAFSNSIEATLTIPSASSLSAEHGSTLSTEGWRSDAPMRVASRHGARLTATIDAPEISISAEHGSTATIRGSFSTTTAESRHGSRVTFEGASAFASLSAEHGSVIEAIDANIASSSASARHGSRIRLGETDLVDREEEHGGSIQTE